MPPPRKSALLKKRKRIYPKGAEKLIRTGLGRIPRKGGAPGATTVPAQGGTKLLADTLGKKFVREKRKKETKGETITKLPK